MQCANVPLWSTWCSGIPVRCVVHVVSRCVLLFCVDHIVALPLASCVLCRHLVFCADHIVASWCQLFVLVVLFASRYSYHHAYHAMTCRAVVCSFSIRLCHWLHSCVVARVPGCAGGGLLGHMLPYDSSLFD